MKSEQLKAIVSSSAILVVTVASLLGFNLDMDDTLAAFMTVAQLIVVIIACWKNMNFTPAACAAQKVLDSIKGGVLTEEEVDAMLQGAKHAKED